MRITSANGSGFLARGGFKVRLLSSGMSHRTEGSAAELAQAREGFGDSATLALAGLSSTRYTV